ncbi:hemicentin-2-like [Babylonia areolata]|uniref:hemicentin-2-like n=1 Tax=Babylonia areolata TaxID=304850 RepID=UPI003FD16666
MKESMTSSLSLKMWMCLAVFSLMWSSSVAQPTIQANGLFVVGQEKTLGCYINSAETVNSFPLTWAKNGVRQAAVSEQEVAVTANVRSYNSFYRFTVTDSDNQAVFTCTASFPSGVTSATWTVYTYKGPDTPIISGPSAAVSDVISTWSCVVDGASNSPPAVFWQFGNNSRLDDTTFSSVAQVYTDSNGLEIHRVTSTLTLTLTPGAPSFTLSCRAVHFDTVTETTADFPVTVLYRPQVSGGSVNYTVTEGSTITLFCQVTAYPLVSAVTWYKDGIRVDMTSGRLSGGTTVSPSLVISNVARADVGFYTCSASNSQGSANGTATYLTIRYIPIITYSQNPVSGLSGSNLTLSCNINSVPPYTTVFWYRVSVNTGVKTAISAANSGAKYVNGTASTTPSLTIRALAATDEGLYRCVADNDVGRGQGGNLQVQVNYPPQIRTDDSHHDVIEGGNVTLECDFDANPEALSVRWVKTSALLSLPSPDGRLTGGTLTMPALTIHGARPSDSGRYQCRVTSALGVASSSPTTLDVCHVLCDACVKYHVVCDVCVKCHVLCDVCVKYHVLCDFVYKPIVKTPNNTFTEQVGGDVTLSCLARGYPPVSGVIWHKAGVPVNMETDPGKYCGASSLSPSLVIHNVSRADSGYYTCQARNTAGMTRSHVITLHVTYAPVIRTDDSHHDVIEGGNVTLACDFDANPEALSVRWVKTSALLSLPSPDGRLTGGTLTMPALTIHGARPSDSGRYQCRVTSALGVASSSPTTLDVVYRPVVRAPWLSYRPTLSNAVSLACSVSGNPPVSGIIWYKASVPVNMEATPGKYSGASSVSASLVIHNVTREDSGPYICQAINAAGSGQSDVIIVSVTYAEDHTAFTFTCPLHGLHMPFTHPSPALYTAFTYPLHGLHLPFTHPSPALYTAFTYPLHGPHLPFTRPSPAVYTAFTFTCRLHGLHLPFTRPSPAFYTAFTCSLHILHLPFTRPSPAFYTAFTCPLHGLHLPFTHPPIMTLKATSYTRNVTDSLTIECSYDANPSPFSVTWTKDSQVIDIIIGGRFLGSSLAVPSLTISDVSSADAGLYVCTAINSIGQGSSDTVNVSINYRPELSSAATRITRLEGTSVTLPCPYSAHPAPTSLLWYKNGVQLSVQGRYSGGTLSTPGLTIGSVVSTDLATYLCRVTNSMGTSSSGPISLDVQYKPQITGGPSSLTATQPQPVTLTCQVDALPTLQSLTWLKDGQLLDTSGTARYSGGTPATPSLTILNVGPGDGGLYVCVAANSVGTTSGPATNLTVDYFPTFSIPSTDITGTSGSSVTLNLSVAANPAVTFIQWRKLDAANSNSYEVLQVTSSSGRYRGGTVVSPSLQIVSLTPADSGHYTLLATNVLGTRQSADFVLTVSSLPPTPTVSNVASSYQEGQPITLSCSTNVTNPAPSFRWFRGSTLVSAGPVLSIASATADSKGQYRCEAYNTLGSSNVSVTINVFYKPRAGSSLSNVTASLGQTVTMLCTTEANPAPSSYTWTHNGQVVSSTSSSSQLTVTVNSDSDVGSYTCQATNDVGTSDAITVFLLLDSSGGDGNTGNTGASTGDSGLSTATLVLIVIVCLIIVVVVVLITIYLCSTRKCFRKENNVGPTQTPAPPPPSVIPYPSKPSDPQLNGYHRGVVPPITSQQTMHNGRISVDESKVPPSETVNGFSAVLSPRQPGVTISLPGGNTPRPHHLPPLGQDGVPQEKESARGDDLTTEKKKKRRRRHHWENSSSQHHGPDHAMNE